MVRSLKFIGAMLTFVAAGTTSAFTTPINTRFSGVTVSDMDVADVHTVRARPSTALSASFDRSNVIMMPATLDKEKVRVGGSGPAVLDRPAVNEKKEKAPAKQKKSTGSEAWEVRIYNDGRNTREFVARCLVQIVGVSEMSAYQTMMQAHQNGIAVVGRYVYEVAEMYYGALKKNGIICDLVPVDEES